MIAFVIASIRMFIKNFDYKCKIKPNNSFGKSLKLEEDEVDKIKMLQLDTLKMIVS